MVKILIENNQLQLMLSRLAHQIIEQEENMDRLVFVGIQPRGIYVLQRILAELQKITNQPIQSGVLDITFYRDDVREELHNAKQTTLQDITGKKVILIDDVLYTGRTIRAALDALQDFGRPSKVELAVLVDRQFSRELPIQPDYLGMAVNTKANQKIKADWEKGQVYLYE